MDSVIKTWQCARCGAIMSMSGQSEAAIEERFQLEGWKHIGDKDYCRECASKEEDADHAIAGFSSMMG